MTLKSMFVGIVALVFLSACDTMSDYGGKMKGWVGLDDEQKYTVYFRSNSTALTEESEGTLYDVMQTIRQEKVEKVRVVGYTDSKGSTRYNQQLSMRRASTIKKKLSTSGAKEIEVSGAGETPEEGGPTGEKARRAEIILIK